MSKFARAFRVTYLDGGHEEDVHYGVQFPSGRCVIDSPLRGMYLAAVDFDDLNLPPDAVVEWADAAVDESNRKIVGLNGAIERATALNRLLGQP